jgi:hypothetical protein
MIKNKQDENFHGKDFINWASVSRYFGKKNRSITFGKHPYKYRFLVEYLCRSMEALVEAADDLHFLYEEELKKRTDRRSLEDRKYGS